MIWKLEPQVLKFLVSQVRNYEIKWIDAFAYDFLKVGGFNGKHTKIINLTKCFDTAIIFWIT